MTTYYFAYGSNMDPQQMESRLGKYTGWVDLGEAWLDGWSMVFAGWSNRRGGAPANVVRSRGSSTLGVLYSLASGQLQEMDRFEGYPYAYERKLVTVRSTSFERARRIGARGSRRGKLVDFFGSSRGVDQSLLPEARRAAETAIADQPLSRLRTRGRLDRSKIESLKSDPTFSRTGRVNTALDAMGELPQITIDPDGVSLGNGRHRVVAARELGLVAIEAALRKVDGRGDVAWTYRGPVRVSNEVGDEPKSRSVRAWIYFKRNAPEGRPPGPYLLQIARAYRRLGYVLESPWLGRKGRRR